MLLENSKFKNKQNVSGVNDWAIVQSYLNMNMAEEFQT